MKTNKAVSIFNFNNQNIRTILIKNEPFFCLKDVCEILGVRNSRHALSRLTPKGVVKTDTLTKGGTQSLNYINEANLYKVIFKSVKPEAIKFEEWVTSEVLPSIRKTGSYNTKYKVTRQKDNTMKESLNPESLSSLTLTDILNDLLLSIEELSCILASSQDSIPASSVAGLLRNITNSTYYQLTKEGADNV